VSKMTVSLRGHDNRNYGQQSSKKLCLQARAEDGKWRSRSDMLQNTVPDTYSNDWKNSVWLGSLRIVVQLARKLRNKDVHGNRNNCLFPWEWEWQSLYHGNGNEISLQLSAISYENVQ